MLLCKAVLKKDTFNSLIEYKNTILSSVLVEESVGFY